MGATNATDFTSRQNKLATAAKAIAHPARIAIIEYLLRVDACICNDIVDRLPLAQPTVSQHLKELKRAGLIKGTIEGNAICYCIDEKGFAPLQQFFETIISKSAKGKTCC